MYAATGNAALSLRRPFLQRLLVRSWEYRHPALPIGVRITAATWNLALGMFLLSYGYWVGLVPLAGSALLLWTVYIVARGVGAQAGALPGVESGRRPRLAVRTAPGRAH